MSVAAYRDRATGRYPITIAEIRQRAPMLFGEEPDEDVLEACEVDPVHAAEAPPHDPQTQQVVEGEPKMIDGAWHQTWAISALSPPPPKAFPPISDRQFFQALATPPYSIITQQEALDAMKTGEIPAVMQAVIDALPEDQQFPATALIAGGTTYERTNPLVAVFGASQGMDDAEIDAFWRFAAGL